MISYAHKTEDFYSIFPQKWVQSSAGLMLPISHLTCTLTKSSVYFASPRSNISSLPDLQKALKLQVRIPMSSFYSFIQWLFYSKETFQDDSFYGHI